jgi:hypothetical protein
MDAEIIIAFSSVINEKREARLLRKSLENVKLARGFRISISCSPFLRVLLS